MLLYSDAGNSKTAQKSSTSKVHKLVLRGALCNFFSVDAYLNVFIMSVTSHFK